MSQFGVGMGFAWWKFFCVLVDWGLIFWFVGVVECWGGGMVGRWNGGRVEWFSLLWSRDVRFVLGSLAHSSIA